MTEYREKISLPVPEQYNGVRIDRFLAEEAENLTRSMAQKLCDSGMVEVDGKPVGKSYKLSTNEIVMACVPQLEELEISPENIPLDVVYEDASLLVVNKPKGMVVHPAPGNPNGTLVNALLWHCGESLSGINGVIRPGIVHRIDKDTSGLLIVAKNDKAHVGLAKQISEHSFTREYEAIVYYGFNQDEGTVDAPIGRHPKERKKQAINGSNARKAVTHYTVLGRYDGFTHMKLRLETGRTHQIRVHMAHIHHPVVGDPVYGPQKVIAETQGQCLHARKIGFVHPETGEYLEFVSDLPEYFTNFLAKLKSKE
ncbi:MAG: RluA family pseudouridine synthase [Oscillospiraceae bacterium]|nr:RluA family pseudouridine synthase [Oscillospiraceae bacterium]